jgi:hypothetical protein
LIDTSPLPIRVVEDAVLRVDGSCVTAETGDTATLLVFNLPPGPPTGGERYVWVTGDGVHFEDIDPATPTLVLSSGARYQFRGIPFDAVDGELAGPMPSSCVHDEQLILYGALDAPVGHGLTTRPVETREAVATIGINSTTITIDGACTTIGSGEHQLLVVWPAGTVSLLDDHTIHMSRWEAVFTEAVVRSGDTVALFGYSSDRTPDDPPPDCEYDGTFFAEVVRPLEATTAVQVTSDVPRLGSTLEEFPLPIRVIEDSILHVDGSCVTAQAGDTAILLVFPGWVQEAWVQGAEVHFEDLYPATPTLVLSSGARYQFRGIPFDEEDAELDEPMPSSCVYDEQVFLLGALDVPVGPGLTTRPVEVKEAVATIGINSTTITIDGACTTVGSGEHQLLVVWPGGTVSLLDDHTIHMSRWEAIFTEAVVRSGDTVMLYGAESDSTPDDLPPDCEYDGTFVAELVRRLEASGRTR